MLGLEKKKKKKKAGIGKGAPARETRTGTRLVSPATGCEKKKSTPPLNLHYRVSECQIEYIKKYYSI